jgi:hypothetical protein
VVQSWLGNEQAGALSKGQSNQPQRDQNQKGCVMKIETVGMAYGNDVHGRPERVDGSGDGSGRCSSIIVVRWDTVAAVGVILAGIPGSCHCEARPDPDVADRQSPSVRYRLLTALVPSTGSTASRNQQRSAHYSSLLCIYIISRAIILYAPPRRRLLQGDPWR